MGFTFVVGQESPPSTDPGQNRAYRPRHAAIPRPLRRLSSALVFLGVLLGRR
jgi:hypothetical protein